MKGYYRKLLILLVLIMICQLSACSRGEYKQVTAQGTETTTSENADTNGYRIEEKTKKLVDFNGVDVDFYADKADMLMYKVNTDKMVSTYISGVNIGLTNGTTDLGNPDVKYETYMEWFGQISEMGANTVRAFTEMPPQFYRALFDYNQSNDEKLYLIQGIWFNENYMYDPADCWDSDKLVYDSFVRGIKELVQIIHGDCTDIAYGNNPKANFDKDVSKWTVGYILGLEWDNDFIENSNQHLKKSSFSGQYLKTTESATAFESFLAEMGNTLVDFETTTYAHQTPVAFLNWATNDTITHTNEPYPEEDKVSVNTENIVSTDKYHSGLFAALDIYPYYPEFINFQPEYAEYKDDITGKKNNYKAYLKDLNKEYSVPVIVAEFGVPTSLGCASESVLGYNQGGITEQEQGIYNSNMIVDIASSGYAGGLLFEWQDEWFKQTWNIYKYAPDNPVQRTPNKVSPEQNYGILAVEAGSGNVCTVDGDAKEWTEKDVISSSKNYSLSAKYDEAYLYFYVNLKNKKSNDTHFVIPVSTVGVGSKKSNKLKIDFNRKTDFIIDVNKDNDARLLTDERYDYFYYKYGKKQEIFKLPKGFGKSNSGEYGIVKEFTTGEIYLPETEETLEPIVNDIGQLIYGNCDTESEDYNSLSSICTKGNTVEIRIPWYLLNVININEGVALNDFAKKDNENTTKFNRIYAGCGIVDNGVKSIKLKSIDYTKSAKSNFHTRLKKSYSYIQQTLKNLYGKY